MGVDYVIDLECVPKQTLGTPAILAYLKARQRAEAILRLYREQGDHRPPSEIGFEMIHRAADGSEHTQVIIVQNLLDEAAQLDPLQAHCANCPANMLHKPYSCFNYINYPISRKAELWLLQQLPTADEPLIYLLVQQTMQNLAEQHDITQQVSEMRKQQGVYFESTETFGRRYDEFTFTSDQVFQLLWLAPSIEPRYAALIMLLFGVIQRNLDARSLIDLTLQRPEIPLPLMLKTEPADDESLYSTKLFLSALLRAYTLQVTISLDA